MYKIKFFISLCFLSSIVVAKGLDPTTPLNEKTVQNYEKKLNIQLQSILSIGNQKKAVINGKILNVGDSYKKYKVISINANQVELESLEGKQVLSLLAAVIVKSK